MLFQPGEEIPGGAKPMIREGCLENPKVDRIIAIHERGCKKSGVKRIRIHDLRHSHVSLLIEMGFSPVEIGRAHV